MSFAASISAIIVSDSEGSILASKYFTQIDREKFEDEFINKFGREENKDGAILTVQRFIVQVRHSADVALSVAFEASENDILLLTFTEAFWKGLNTIASSKKKLVEKLDQVFLMIDESCENGVILDDDAESLMKKIEMRDIEVPSTPQGPTGSDSYSGFRSVFASARGQLGAFLSR